MKIGTSTACWYPLETEKSLKRIGELGINTAEIFFNTASELGGSILKEIIAIKEYYGINVCSVHPFLAFAESYMLFSDYKRRYEDVLENYKKYFEACGRLGAKIFVYHGINKHPTISDEIYFERSAELMELGRNSGIIVAQENVNNHLSASPLFLEKMRDYIGSDFKMVFDIKQVYRAGHNVFDFAEKLADSIAHIHISDHQRELDCLPPGEGDFDFARFFAFMKNRGYSGEYIIELYRWNFKEDIQIAEARKYLMNKAGF